MERTFAAWCLCGSLTNFPHIILPYANLFNRINSLICTITQDLWKCKTNSTQQDESRYARITRKNNNSEIIVLVCKARPEADIVTYQLDLSMQRTAG